MRIDIRSSFEWHLPVSLDYTNQQHDSSDERQRKTDTKQPRNALIIAQHYVQLSPFGRSVRTSRGRRKPNGCLEERLSYLDESYGSGGAHRQGNNSAIFRRVPTVTGCESLLLLWIRC